MTLSREEVQASERESLLKRAVPDPETIAWLHDHVEPVVAAIWAWERKQAIGGLTDPYIDAILKAAITPRVYWSRENSQRVSSKTNAGASQMPPGTLSPPMPPQMEQVVTQRPGPGVRTFWDEVMDEFYPHAMVEWDNKAGRVIAVRTIDYIERPKWLALAQKLGKDWQWDSQGRAFVPRGSVPTLYQKKA